MRELKQMRENAGLTQGEVAKQLKFTSPQFISNIERGLATLPPEHIKKIAGLYKVPQKKLTDLKLKEFENDLRKRM